MAEGSVFATRLFAPEHYCMTAGINVPFNLGMLEDIQAELPRRLCERPLPELIDNRHFAEAVYRIALADGITNDIVYRDLPDDT
jgi:hypothetical protein